ncbi:hypothetical protein SADUNF_Sadunf17G0084400 [Salix dunnii]|uniref:RRM domain-containing protein n=1 Tax=Salix dunnii TaxID=1413687 RepID=A0A835J8K1_9ROSI|nr:hypothetical protein SADUNF_Sadunf17G0084400 [Salix dunnii]
MSTSGQPQFRYTQTPSKVLHLRNLPWECTEEELIELCEPFGKIVNTKCNVGNNRNQAFVEFVEQNQAIQMVSYYASSSEPAQVRGKTVYIQYSNRHEIVNNKSPGDNPGNVLLVTIEGVEAGDVSIDVIHLVFSAFGYVHKIATFEKAAGFQALIQFTDAETASSARNALDGRSIPRHTLLSFPNLHNTPYFFIEISLGNFLYLLPEHVGSCNLRISYSAHTDLNIKFQSHRSSLLHVLLPLYSSLTILVYGVCFESLFISQHVNAQDYTNPYLPVNPTAIDGPVQSTVGADGKKKEPESNVLLASIENMQYAVTVDVLHTVFSGFGTVQKIAIFEKNGGTQALIQFPGMLSFVMTDCLQILLVYCADYLCWVGVEFSSTFLKPGISKSITHLSLQSGWSGLDGRFLHSVDVATAAVAKETLEGHCIYDGGYCKLHLSYSRHTDLNVKAFSDKSRDYTVPNASFLTAQAPGLHTATTSWQNQQAGSMYLGSNYASTAAAAQVPPGQVPVWDQTIQAGVPGYASARGTYPGQTYPTPPAYASSAIPPGSSPLSYSNPISSGVASMGMTHPGVQPNMRPGGASPPGQAPYYGR